MVAGDPPAVLRAGAAATGEATAFSDWVRPHLAAMAAVASRLASPADRDDVVQEALVRAWRKWASYDERRGAPLRWLLAITADRAFRRRRPRPTAELFDVALDVPQPDIDLERALLTLAPRQRLAVTLFYFAGLDIAGTSQAMGCAPGTVKSTLADARARLRTALEER